MMILATKHLYERGSSESKSRRRSFANRFLEFLREHSLTIFLSCHRYWMGAFVRTFRFGIEMGTGCGQHSF